MAEAIDRQTVLSFPVVPASIWEGESSMAHVARELHDGVAGELSTMLLDLERFRTTQVGRGGVLAEISRLQDQLRFVLANVRQVLSDQRGLPGLDPDLVGALRRGFLRTFSERTGIRVHLSVSRGWPAILPAQSAQSIRRIVQEALNNVDRHSGGSSVLVRFELLPAGQGGKVTITDDGRGYPAASDGWQRGLGLVGIEERATLLGARVTVSNRPRGGGVLSVSLTRGSLGL